LRFAQMLANGGVLDGERILAPTSVTLMTSNLLPAGVPMRFLYPFAGVGYGMGVGIVLDPAHADFNGGAIGAGTYYWGGVHWVNSTGRRNTSNCGGARWAGLRGG
jgi:CubicO group peptidase (beta-lactamase class C family)